MLPLDSSLGHSQIIAFKIGSFFTLLLVQFFNFDGSPLHCFSLWLLNLWYLRETFNPPKPTEHSLAGPSAILLAPAPGWETSFQESGQQFPGGSWAPCVLLIIGWEISVISA